MVELAFILPFPGKLLIFVFNLTVFFSAKPCLLDIPLNFFSLPLSQLYDISPRGLHLIPTATVEYPLKERVPVS